MWRMPEYFLNSCFHETKVARVTKLGSLAEALELFGLGLSVAAEGPCGDETNTSSDYVLVRGK